MSCYLSVRTWVVNSNNNSRNILFSLCNILYYDGGVNIFIETYKSDFIHCNYEISCRKLYVYSKTRLEITLNIDAYNSRVN